MSMNRAQIDAGGNFIRAALPGDLLLSQAQVASVTTAGSGVWPAAAMLSGFIDRSGPGAGYADTPDTADNILAACPNLSVGDSFEFTVRNTVAFANTVAVSTGVELVGGNTAITASLWRDYLMTCLANKRQTILQVNTTNASAVLTGLTQAQADSIMPGMGVTGTNIPASTTVNAVNSVAGTATMSANATGTGTVAATFFPRFTLRGTRMGTL